jgi:putative transposase
MSRPKRVVIPDLPYHIVQRASHQRFILDDSASRAILMKSLVSWQIRTGMKFASFVLMGNHFHLVGTSPTPNALSSFMSNVCAEYSRYYNAVAGRQGPNWEGRYFAAPMDAEHTLRAIRYIEQNPVAAHLVDLAWEWPWSSAAFHSGMGPQPQLVNLDLRPANITPKEWRDILTTRDSEDFRARFKAATLSGRAFGEETWAVKTNLSMGRSSRRAGRPKRATPLPLTPVAQPGLSIVLPGMDLV